MSTYGNTGNEGGRGYNDGYDHGNTYGAQGNEPSQHRGNDGDNDPTNLSQSGSGSDSRGGNGRHGGNSSYPNQTGGGSFPNTGGPNTGGNLGNEPSRQGPYNPNTYGTYGNEPSRHREINIDVNLGGNKESSIRMTASLDWTLDKLHSSSAKRMKMVPGQCRSICEGVTVSGLRKVHETRIRNGSSLTLHIANRGG